MKTSESICKEEQLGRGRGRFVYWILAAGVWLCALGILLLSYDIWFFMLRV